MSQDEPGLLPERVDARRLAEQGGHLEGRYPSTVLERLAALALEVKDARARLDFIRDEGGRLQVRGEVQGGVVMSCQRCLEPVAIALEGAFEFSPEDEGEEFLVEPGRDALPLDTALPVRALVEDELLLLCPMIPSHPPGECQAASNGQDSADGNARKNPFDVLAALRQNAKDPPSGPAAARNPEE